MSRRAGGLGGVVMMFGGGLEYECRDSLEGGFDETGECGLTKGTLR